VKRKNKLAKPIFSFHYAVVFWKKKKGFVKGLARAYLFFFFRYFFSFKKKILSSPVNKLLLKIPIFLRVQSTDFHRRFLFSSMY